MKMGRKTTLYVSEDVWKEVKTRKQLGETVDDVLRRILDLPVKETV